MTSIRRLPVLAVLAAALGCTSYALAATPSDGTVGKSAPKITWKGSLTSSGIYNNAWEQDPTIPCQSPACDPFTLHVADGGINLTVSSNVLSENAAGGDPGCGIRIQDPGGAYTFNEGTCGTKTTFNVKLKNVKAGDYVIDIVSSHACCGPEDFQGTAFIPELAGPATSPAPGASPTPSATPGASPSPQPAATTTLTIKPGKASAKKITKTHKYAVTVSSSGPLTGVTARLLKGKKAIATAKLSSLSGTAKLVLKASKKTKVKKGTYSVAVSGKDAQGRVVAAGVKVKVTK